MNTIAPLTDDERTVLLIACEGQYLIPHGRWRDPVLMLAARGFLQKLDDVNYVITAAGRSASDAAEEDVLRDFLKVGQRAYHE